MKISRYITITLALLLSLSIIPFVQADGQSQQTLWVGQYYNNTSRAGSPVLTRIDNTLNFDWGQGSPNQNIANDNFSAQWRANVNLSAGSYRFWVRADDQVRVLVDGNEIINSFATNVVDQVLTGDITLAGGNHILEVEYREYIGAAFLFLDYANLSIGETGPDFEQITPPTSLGTWVAYYYPNTDLTGNPVAIIGVPTVGGNWGAGTPIAALPNDLWSARWETTIALNANTYRFSAKADDGVRVYVDGNLIIDEWHVASPITYTQTRTLTAGLHRIVVEYYESGGAASLEFDLVGLSSSTVSNIPTVNTTTNTNTSPVVTNSTVTIATGRLNVRDIPNPFTGQVLTRVTEGDIYPVIARNTSNTWVQINVNGTVGWVNASYVAFNNATALPVIQNPTSTSNTTPITATQYTVTATPFTVNIRSGPGTNFDDIANFSVRDTAQVIGRNADSTWWQIRYEGIVGWVSARYARIETGANIASIPVTE